MAASTLLVIVGILHLTYGLVDYVLYPVNKYDVAGCSQTNDALVTMFPRSRVRAYQSQIRQTTEFWFIQSLEAQNTALTRIPGVRIPSRYLHETYGGVRWTLFWRMS